MWSALSMRAGSASIHPSTPAASEVALCRLVYCGEVQLVHLNRWYTHAVECVHHTWLWQEGGIPGSNPEAWGKHENGTQIQSRCNQNNTGVFVRLPQWHQVCGCRLLAWISVFNGPGTVPTHNNFIHVAPKYLIEKRLECQRVMALTDRS